MTSWRRGPIHDGDWIIAYLSKDNIHHVKLQKGRIFNSKFGHFQHDDIIGKVYGSRVASKTGGYITVLAPTPELLTAGALATRTQIIFTVDISIITMYLELKPGSVVIESGTGSGSLSRAIARTIAPTGHLYTFEYHAQRASAARQDFLDSGLAGVITVTNRDACELGYGFEPTQRKADAVMLDLPSPWLAIPHAAAALRHYGTICNFSPCIEQVQRACETLTRHGFSEIITMECLLRPYEVKAFDFEPIRRPSARGQKRVLSNTTAAGQQSKKTGSELTKKEEESDGEDDAEDAAREKEADKKEAEQNALASVNSPPAAASGAPSSRPRPGPSARPEVFVRGHTSYLTFARYLAPSAEKL
jgi:tRNA (adenine57-N1/adenine58-N1)-methyltransferase